MLEKRVTVLLSDVVYAALSRKCFDTGTKMSTVLRELAEEYVCIRADKKSPKSEKSSIDALFESQSTVQSAPIARSDADKQKLQILYAAGNKSRLIERES